MAEVEEGENQNAEKVRHWLVRATSAPPDAAWLCLACGSSNMSWTPLCNRCGGLGTLEWGTENNATTLDSPIVRELSNQQTDKESGTMEKWSISRL